MNKIFTIILLLISFTYSYGQDYLGLSTGNYSGIHGVMLQPSNVADNRYKFEINLVSTNIGFQNNYLGFSRDYFINNRFSFKDFDSYQDFKSKVLTENNVTGNNVQFNLNNRLNLPSVMVTTGEKSGIAVGFQSRTVLAVDNMNAAFAKQLYNEWQYAPTHGQQYNLNGMNVTALNWFEGNFTYGRVLLERGKHFLKAGVTAKYLGGVSSWYLHANDLGIIANNDSSLSLQGNEVEYGHSPTNISGQILKNYSPDASGFGFDAGVVYEYRGKIDKFKFLKLNKESDEYYTSTRRDQNKYLFKVGVSLIDAGRLTFNSTPLARDFGANVNNINIKNLGIDNVQDLDTFISNNVNYLSAQTGKEFSVAMPTALSAQVDLHLVKGFYVNAMAYMPFTQLNKNVDYRVFTPNYYAVTPRWESRVAGVYVPLTYSSNMSDLNDFNIGATVRVGPVFAGSGNLLTLLRKDNIQSANVHVGFKIPVAHGKPSKTSQWLKKITNEVGIIAEKKADEKGEGNESQEPIEIEQNIEKKDKKDKAKEEESNRPIQIIINNYNGMQGESSQKIIEVDPVTGKTIEKTIYIDSEKKEQNNTGFGNLQDQIDFLKFKLQQKEQLIQELEKEKERIQNGNSQEGSKKKIDSLKNDFLNRNDFRKSVPAKKMPEDSLIGQAQIFEFRKEILDLEKKNAALDKKLVTLANPNTYRDIEGVDNQSQRKLLLEIKDLVEEIRENEKNGFQSATDISQISNNENNIGEELSKAGTGTHTQSSKNNLGYSPIEKDLNLFTKSDAKTLMSKEDYESLKNEIITLRSELKTYQRQQIIGTNQKEKTVQKEVILPVRTEQDVKIVRDTIYIQKPIEKVVTQIVRDTITNTIEKNNTITKTETKIQEIKVDYTADKLLARPPYFVLFDVGSKTIKRVYQDNLNDVAVQLSLYTELKVSLVGHTDATGNPAKNLLLSKARANAVKEFLVSKGVSPTRIFAEYEGDKIPLE